MKISERVVHDTTEGKIVVVQKHNFQPYIEKARMLRDQNSGVIGESRCAGIIPMKLLAEWAKEAGVRWDDRPAMRDVIRRKMLSGDFDKLRVWEGKF